MNAGRRGPLGRCSQLVLLACLGALVVPGLQGQPKPVDINLVVLDAQTNTPVGDVRWLLEEDRTYHPVAGQPDAKTLAVSFHRSYMPVVAKGEAKKGAGKLTIPDPGKRYYVSVLPKLPGTYTMGGAPIGPDESTKKGQVIVFLHRLPLPTAQITIFIFHDNAPINNAPDVPDEQGLENFSIILEDAGGRFGASAGQQSKDAFDNPLGTEYQQNADGTYVLGADGQPIVSGWKPLKTDANGLLTVKHLAPGKYGVIAAPPQGTSWQQTSTIEGTPVIDAWVKANEPPYFQEFGPPGYHVFIGFIQPMKDTSVLSGGATISGRIVNQHLSRPPDYAFYNGAPLSHTKAWVGLNTYAGEPGLSKGVYAMPTNDDGSFSITGVPPGDYQLVVFDENLLILFASHGVRVEETLRCNGRPTCHLADIPVFQWFTNLLTYVFNDANGDGVWGPDEKGMSDQVVNLRWRDGTLYQFMATGPDGDAPFNAVFPFFAWQVAEVDAARYKTTGVTVVVDEGGAIDPNGQWTFEGQLNPQPQPDNAGGPYRWAPGALTQAFQGFLGQTSALIWGKKAYGPGENGGISGIVYYDTVRAEDDPRYNFPEVWQPGIPNVEVRLYDATGKILLYSTKTDSWDDDPPTGCVGEPFTFMGQPTDCYDGLRNFNQVRPGVFDGGYAFTECFVGAGGTCVEAVCTAPGVCSPKATGTMQALPAGEYVVQVVPPVSWDGKPTYEVVKEQDKNVDFGEDYEPAPDLIPPECVGSLQKVPSELTLFPGVRALYGGQSRPLCDKKLVPLSNGSNAMADFFLFTEVPIAAHAVGFILDDTQNEFDAASPQFGEKFAPPWLPISIRDWSGREIGRTVSDQFGRYNFLVASTYTTNQPNPSGMSPAMYITCMNSKSTADGKPDPNHNRQYSEFCYTFQYMPGATTYLDTPVVPVAAHAGPDRYPLDCELPDGTPRISEVNGDNNAGGGPYVAQAGHTLTIQAMGMVEVPNPAYCPGPPISLPGACPEPFVTAKTILRDYGFGVAQGTVTIDGVEQNVTSWGQDSIIIAATNGGQLVVTRSDNGKSTMTGVTVTVGAQQPRVVNPGQSIQAAIDDAAAGDLILVKPGIYSELVIMWKPVQLQGTGEGSTIIDAVKTPTEKLKAWRAKVKQLVDGGLVNELPGQELTFIGIEPTAFWASEGAGVFVVAKATGAGSFQQSHNARIDGFTIRGADTGGGVAVNGYAKYLEISNNRIVNNSGVYGGGIRLGEPLLVYEANEALHYTDADNDNIKIHNNQISQNGGAGGAGGGVSICTGADNYEVTQNFICGNFTLRDGGGIGHYGKSNNGLISQNTILFNENFNQGVTVTGGGIFVGGAPPLAGMTQSPGSGSVEISRNLIQGNLAGTGNGGGIRIQRANGQDVADSPTTAANWFTIDIVNNMIVNNISGLAGGGISLQDAVSVNILHNTVAHNDSTGTAAGAFLPGSPNQSDPQPAGIVAHAHSPALSALVPTSFSLPELWNNIVWKNRSFYFSVDPDSDPAVYALLPRAPDPVWDLAVLGTTGTLTCESCLLTNGGDPSFVEGYFNGPQGVTVAQPEATTALEPAPAFDEGGNYIRVRFGPLTLVGDYHIQTGSTAQNGGSSNGVTEDFDGDSRDDNPDIGADELPQP